MRHIIFYLLTGFILLGCNTKTVNAYLEEVKTLTTPESQIEYLEAIAKSDQEVRKESSLARQFYGIDSEEEQTIIKKMMEVDNVNLAKIEAFLSIIGHPSIEVHGKSVSSVPCLVVHHAGGGIHPRERNFSYFYDAWKKGDLDGGMFTFYLNRWHDIKFGHRLEIESPFTEEFEIDTLLQVLEIGKITPIKG